MERYNVLQQSLNEINRPLVGLEHRSKSIKNVKYFSFDEENFHLLKLELECSFQKTNKVGTLLKSHRITDKNQRNLNQLDNPEMVIKRPGAILDNIAVLIFKPRLVRLSAHKEISNVLRTKKMIQTSKKFSI